MKRFSCYDSAWSWVRLYATGKCCVLTEHNRWLWEPGKYKFDWLREWAGRG